MSQAKSSFLSDLAAIQTNLDQQVEQIIEISQTQKTKTKNPNPAIAETLPTENSAHLHDKPTKRREAQPKIETNFAAANQLVNVTTRLTSTTNEKLTEVAYRQKLKKQTPDTRQQIIEEALKFWFRKTGYGDIFLSE